MLGCDGGRLALGLPKRSPGSRHHDQREYHGGGAKDAHALILSVSGQVASESSRQWRLRRPPTPSRCTPRRTVSSALLFGPPPSSPFASGEIPIEKSYRVCSVHLRALIGSNSTTHPRVNRIFQKTRRIAAGVANALSRTQSNCLAHRFRARPQAVRCALPERNAAMTKVRVGLVGCGFVAELHMYAYQRVYGLDAQVTAVAARGDHVLDFSKKHRIRRTHRDFKSLLADKEIDVVDIFTPPPLRAARIVHGLQAGKNLICEKPFT